jgi:hypothetical protein
MIVDPGGTLRFIHDDAAVKIAKAVGPVTIKRASHVEPTGDGRWEADMSPVLGPVLRGFETRQEALDAEVKWLHAHNVPIPQ